MYLQYTFISLTQTPASLFWPFPSPISNVNISIVNFLVFLLQASPENTILHYGILAVYEQLFPFLFFVARSQAKAAVFYVNIFDMFNLKYVQLCCRPPDQHHLARGHPGRLPEAEQLGEGRLQGGLLRVLHARA